MFIIWKIPKGSSRKVATVNQLLPYVTLCWFISPHMQSIHYSSLGLNFSPCTQVTPGVLLVFQPKYIILCCGMYSLTSKTCIVSPKWDLLAAENQINHPSACFSEWKYGLGSSNPVAGVHRLNTGDCAEFRDSDGTPRYFWSVFVCFLLTVS